MKHLIDLSTPRQRLLLLACLLAALVLIAADVTLTHAQVAVPNSTVCAAGTTKYEAGSGYEYGEEHAEITLAGPYATWEAQEPDDEIIYRVCLKAGTQLHYPSTGPRSGEFTVPDGKDVSHLVVYMQAPNAVGLTDFTAEPLAPPAGFDQRYLIVSIIFVAGAVILASTIVHLRRKER